MTGLNDYSYVFITCEGKNEEAVFYYIEENRHFVIKDRNCYSTDYIRTHTTKSRKALLNTIFEYDFDGPVCILDIKDRFNESWKLSKTEQKLIEEKNISIISVVTYPEIEILLVLKNEVFFREWQKKKSDVKPSEFCKEHYGCDMKNGKDFLLQFSSFEEFKNICEKYKKQSSNKDVLTLFDIME
ncbi:hypothetical protein [Anaerovibrio lipolyticus]|uniref:hypothetical protein n=1 Tax=Anaerovibrio lipolyticus TaxID=82374 RepID=UPI0026EE5B0F|nr:hypothetical protein [Anaerovibrio lipolyticus]MBE6105977.1 hypothetical protein [Anaerovibrio lipolyticus]